MRINEGFLAGSIGGGIVGSLAPVAMGLPFGPIGILAAFAGSIICSGLTTIASGDRIIYPEYRYTPAEPEGSLTEKKINHERIGYIRARGWKEPFTPEQQAKLNELYPE